MLNHVKLVKKAEVYFQHLVPHPNIVNHVKSLTGSLIYCELCLEKEDVADWHPQSVLLQRFEAFKARHQSC